MCSKSARILLAGIIKKHPNLFSYIIQRLNNNFSKAGKVCILVCVKYNFKLLNVYNVEKESCQIYLSLAKK